MNELQHGGSVDEWDDARSLTRAACLILMLASLASMTARIGGIESREKTPMISANDRSRWCTVRALVDDGTYAIDTLVFRTNEDGKLLRDRNGKLVRDPKWQTIDMVRHRGADGKEHYYSSKPPLLPTMIAGGYWAIKKVFGLEIVEEYSAIIRALLVLINVVPLALLFWLTWRLCDRYCRHEWSRLFVIAVATWGTFLTTFAVVLNNHLPAAVSTMVAIYAVFQVLARRDQRLSDDQDAEELPDASWGWHVLAGLAAGFAAANELPALSLLVALGLGLTWAAPLRSLGYYLAAGAVGVAFFATNLVAHNSWKPPYMHRSDGAVVATAEVNELAAGEAPAAIRDALGKQLIQLGPDAVVEEAYGDDRWQLFNPFDEQRWALQLNDGVCTIREWNDWYEYERSHWRGGDKKGVDRGEPNVAKYAAHVLVGHHGIFSLTPVWLLTLVGIGIALRQGEGAFRGFALLTGALWAVCTAFYIARPLDDRNYGGVSCGFRWLYWQIPMWTIAMIPALDWVAERPRLRNVAIVLLTIGVGSAAYASAKPFSHPWLYDFWVYLGWASND
ncbi:MAG: hypothetical protein KDB14_20010 [Planctomycetales bacterium]|nr:hypothetical protein [Planctomycetales bacterium]